MYPITHHCGALGVCRMYHKRIPQLDAHDERRVTEKVLLEDLAVAYNCNSRARSWAALR